MSKAMVVNKKIDSCYYCYYCTWEQGKEVCDLTPYCTHPKATSSPKLSADTLYDSIPDWCPLEDQE